MQAGLTALRSSRVVGLGVASLLGVILAFSFSTALGGHDHTQALWKHGYGYGDDYTNRVHPYLLSTDGAGRGSYVAYQKYSYHSDEQYRLDNHNHMDFTTTLPKRAYEASTRSPQTSLTHHHHCHHDGCL